MDPRFSLKRYPRVDRVYELKSSFNFEAMNAKVYLDRKRGKFEEGSRWLVHLLIGIVVGIIAFFMTLFEDELVKLHGNVVQMMLDNGRTVQYTYAYWAAFSVVCAFIAGLLTVYIGPGAYGSGVPEVMGILNGVKVDNAMDISTLIIKIVAVEFAVISGLAVGKEGPLLHIGAIVGWIIPYLPMKCFECFRNDTDKRTFMAAGASAGVSAAFGSPIGGALFTYEISKPTSFWTFSMLWRVFFTCAISTLTLAILYSLNNGSVLSLNSAAVLKFGTLAKFDSPLSDFYIAIILGIICGLLGAFFIYVYV